MFFMINDVYEYDASKIKLAHEWCIRETFKALSMGRDVVVSNTFVQLWQLVPYQEMCKTFGIEPLVMVATNTFSNVHLVPESVINKMSSSWEHYGPLN